MRRQQNETIIASMMGWHNAPTVRMKASARKPRQNASLERLAYHPDARHRVTVYDTCNHSSMQPSCLLSPCAEIMWLRFFLVKSTWLQVTIGGSTLRRRSEEGSYVDAVEDSRSLVRYGVWRRRRLPFLSTSNGWIAVEGSVYIN